MMDGPTGFGLDETKIIGCAAATVVWYIVYDLQSCAPPERALTAPSPLADQLIADIA